MRWPALAAAGLAVVVAAVVAAGLLFLLDDGDSGRPTRADVERLVRETYDGCPGGPVRHVRCTPGPGRWSCSYVLGDDHAGVLTIGADGDHLELSAIC